MRFAELALISLPVLLVLAWFAGLRHASYRAFMAIALALAALGAGLFWMGTGRVIQGTYAQARWQNGRVLPGGPP